MVNMSYLQPRENMFINAFKNLYLTKCHPNIFEFNWSGNKASSYLFNFILTQKDLQFLVLLEMSVEKPKPFFQCLTSVVNDMHLIGLDIGCGTFDEKFSKIRHLNLILAAIQKII